MIHQKGNSDTRVVIVVSLLCAFMHLSNNIVCSVTSGFILFYTESVGNILHKILHQIVFCSYSRESCIEEFC